jgi:DNA adenine methylase
MTQVKQKTLFPESFDITTTLKPVNVASVPQRSPFRYPGGKTWFIPTFRQWMYQKHFKPNILIEPFAGGGIISLTALFENFVSKVVMAELDDEIAAVWQSVVKGDAEWIANRILSFDLNRETVIQQIQKKTKSLKEKAFQTILKNRTFHGGILAEGSGFLKYGENGKGIHSRWYPATLAKRFVNLNYVAEKIEFRCRDGIEALKEYASRQDVVYFIDPPYTAGGKKAGKRLYKHYEIDHEQLFTVCKSLRGDFLITYDNADEVKVMARRHGFQMRLIPMTNTHHATMEELVIGKDLTWMDRFPAVHEPEGKYVTRKKKRSNKPI